MRKPFYMRYFVTNNHHYSLLGCNLFMDNNFANFVVGEALALLEGALQVAKTQSQADEKANKILFGDAQGNGDRLMEQMTITEPVRLGIIDRRPLAREFRRLCTQYRNLPTGQLDGGLKWTI
jgi:hypothetical protein